MWCAAGRRLRGVELGSVSVSCWHWFRCSFCVVATLVLQLTLHYCFAKNRYIYAHKYSSPRSLSSRFLVVVRYAMSYDWSQGVEHANPQGTNNIYVHTVADEEIKPRPKDKK